MAKKGKKSKSKKESKEKLVATSPLVDSDNNKVDTSKSEADDDFDKLLQEFIDSQLPEDESSTSSSSDDEDSSTVPENISNCPILKCPQFETIANALLAKDWKLDIRAIDKNILHFSKGDERFMLYLFYGSEKGESNGWLADEEKFNGEEPLWFSEDSHVVSPMYAANEYSETLDYKKVSYSQPVVVMMHPHYVINAEDMISIWEDKLIVSIDKLCKLIKEGEDLDCVDTKADDIGREPDKDKRYKHHDISAGVISVSDSVNSTETDKDWVYNDGIDTDADDFKEIEITKMRFYIDPMDGSADDVTPTLSTLFRAINAEVALAVVYDAKGEINPDAKYAYELRDDKNKIVAKNTIALHRNYHNEMKEFSLDLPSISEGKYWFYFKHNGKELYSKKLTFANVKKDYRDLISLDTVGLHRMNECDYFSDHNAIVARGSQICYNYHNLEGVLMVSLFRNISDEELPYQFIVSVENEFGKIVFEEADSGLLSKGESFQFVKEIREVVCPTGNYALTIMFLDQVVFMCDFVVGHKDIKTKFKISKTVLLAEKRKGVRRDTTDPMKELDSMVGLSNLKKQLHKFIAKIKVDKIRKEQGLPTKSQQLHMAFLGNPGTGKTSIAKLLGRALKDIGILSRGHVEFRDRSTLMTQNWGGEGEMVTEALEFSKGGILFIDEAYDLVTDHKTDPGKLIISALLQSMADEKNRDFMVIFAGYTMQMERLLSKNPGLRSRLTTMYFDDYDVSEMMQIADLWLGKNCYKFTPDARRYFESIINSAYAMRDENFGNARYVINLLESEVQPALAERIIATEDMQPNFALLTTIEACDIPNYNAEKDGSGEAIARLDKMIGLGELKSQIRSHLSYIRFVQARRDNKIDTPIPPLHMVFTGNPGTGKTSVAEYLGDIYRSMGILSVGNVIKVTRADMIDSAIGGTEEKMKELLNAAHGNILFIDEAYTLFSKSGNDVGKNAVEVMLDALGKENMDMIVIMAGYPKEMEELLTINPGLKGRFPYTFNFEDYNEDELFEIAEGVVKRNSLNLTKGAKDALRAMIRKECKIKDSNFSNARFVVRLITTQVLPNMAVRLEGETDPEKLKRILQRDIPIEYKKIRMINENLFDEEMIESALERLDAMVGLTKVKVAIHQFVDFARNINRKDPTQIERYPLKWSFVGNTGTGKSSVAEVLSEILKAMHLLGKGHTVEVKAEELYGVATYKADELLQQRMRESLQGLLFVDGDAPQFRASNSSFNPDYLRMCLAVNTNEIRGRFAVVIAEQDSPKVGLAKSLNKIGISNFDHTLIFDDYTAEELMAILTQQLAKHNLTLSPDAATIMYSYIQRLCADNKSGGDANARTMKELARTIRNIASASGCESYTISADAVVKFSTLQSPRTKIGY